MNSSEIQARFLSPCCWRENLARHNSPEAVALRGEIDTLVKQGLTEEQIVERFVKKYGERILREPRGSRQAFLTTAPVLFLLLGLLWVIYWLFKARRRALSTATSSSASG